jgi:hypothetical protein
MMQSDFFALAACAISILYVPFLLIAQLRFAHIMQWNGYSGGRYMAWLGRGFTGVYVPLIGICLIVLVGKMVLKAYLDHTALYEIPYIAGFFVVLLVIAAAVAFVYYKYVKEVKMESELTPLVCSRRLVTLYIAGCMLVCAVVMVENLLPGADVLVYVAPLFTPMIVPLANALTGMGRKEAEN